MADFTRLVARPLLGQVKVSFINSKMKFETDAATLYFNDKRGLYKTFGLYQMVESIRKLIEKPEWIDKAFPKGKKIQIYPVIVYADRFLQTPLMNVNFQKEFIKQLKDSFSGVKNPNQYYHEVVINNISIKPITLMYIGDLESIEPYLANKTINIWGQLKTFYFYDGLQSPFIYSLMAKQRKLKESGRGYLFDQIRPMLEDVQKFQNSRIENKK